MNSIDTGKTTIIEPKIIKREKRMVDAMGLIYCKDRHGYENALCTKCFERGVYAKKRLAHCRYKEKN